MASYMFAFAMGHPLQLDFNIVMSGHAFRVMSYLPYVLNNVISKKLEEDMKSQTQTQF